MGCGKRVYLARWGGEEFIFLLPGTGIEGGMALAEKLREAVAEAELSFDGLRLHIFMTFGVTEFAPGDDIERCVVRADNALYEGKEAGRNRVVAASVQGQ
ncbi:MAG: diguanylate cyclase, partial [Rhodospirillales bacterium]|nr:diguanylate cyclase [Rhodospirillales bacterium]